MTLALLLAAVGGALAQSSLNVVEFEVPADWENDNSPVTAGDLPGFNASTSAEAWAWTGATSDNATLFYAFDGDQICFVDFFEGAPSEDNKTEFTKQGVFSMKSIIKFYYTAEITEWPLTPDANKKVWTLDKMPGSDIELQVEYYAESNLFLGKEALADKANIAVKNGETAVAFDDEGKSTTTVSEGNTVTATYTGTKKVIGMTVTKRVSLVYPIVISEVTDEAYIGSVVAADGYVYATEDDVVNASKTPVAKICYVGSETGDATYKHGLALALRDVSEIKSWCSQSNNNCLVSQYTTVAEAKGDLAGIANTDVLVGTTPHSHGDNAAKAARGYNSGTHPDGTSEWFLPSVGQWDKMATAVGDYGKLGLNSGNYWSSTEIDAENAWSVNGGSWSTDKKHYNQGIRACLAF